MSSAAPVTGPIRFGVFEVDLASRTLRKRGVRIRVQELPFRLLSLLIERAGEVITRDELQQQLWPSEQYGDFDFGLNTAVTKLRQALSDSAGTPRYIETVPKVGYRFIGQITADVPATEEPAPVRDKRSIARGLAWLFGVALLALLAVHLSETPADRPVRRFVVAPPGMVSSGPISPDGRHILFVTQANGRLSLWVRSLSDYDARELPGTTGAIAGFWSPDSQSVGFVIGAPSYQLKRVLLNGGDPITLCDLPVTSASAFIGGTWSADGQQIVFSSGHSLFKVSAEGGKTELLYRPGEGERPFADYPQFLPPTEGASQSVVYTAIGSDRMLTVLNMDTGERRELALGARAVHSPAGYLIHESSSQTDDRLWALPFSLASLSSSGESFPIAEEGSFAGVAQDGTLAYEYDPDGDLSTLVWRDRAGELLERVGQPQGGMQAPVISPDGRMVAVTSLESGNQDIWIHDLKLAAKTRVTFESNNDHSPSWSPDGRQILYRRLEGSKRVIMSRAADGTGEVTVLTEADTSTFGLAWSRDGRYVVYHQYNPRSDHDIRYLELDAQGKPSKPKSFLNSPAREEDPALSPDSRYMAFQSNASGRPEIYVRPFPAGPGQWQASFSGGTQPRWRSDGSELYFVASGALMAVPVTYEPNLRLGRPQKLFESSDLLPPAGMPLYDVSADGQRFLTIAALEGDATAPPVIHVVENWLEELSARDR